VIGPVSGVPNAPNIKTYGEMAYEDVVPYVKWADIALNPRTIPTLADSNKVIQYEYCRLPIVMSEVDACDRPHVFRYRPGDSDSIFSALKNALQYDRRRVRGDIVCSWDSVAEALWGGSLDV
jgi:2-beta-glucuronyltransferase